jgi:uncharacterized protein YndB with AHSA1/START domain
MMVTKETIYTKDQENKKLKVTREFDGPLDKVWAAWTESEILDQWWAPRPWKAFTVSMDFKPGGKWLYYMQGPDNSRHYCRVDFKSITPGKQFVSEAAFCDENGNINKDMPIMYWKVDFNKSGDETKVDVELSFNTIEEMNKIIEMGFKEGFAMGLNQLDELLASK